MSSKISEKIAVITIGRWQPPHRGHEVLIRDTLNMARELRATPFVWISPSRTDMIPSDMEEGEILERTVNDPLSVPQRVYYLSRMYPKKEFPRLKFLTDYPALSLRYAYEEELHTGKSVLTRRNPGNHLPENWDAMTTCERYKYKNLITSGLLNKGRVQIVRDRLAKVTPGERRLPSKQCLNWLRSPGRQFTKVILLVGSDRVAAFRKYNQDLGDELFDEFRVVQSGFDRGATGQQVLELTRSISDDDGDADIRELSQLMDGLSLSPAQQAVRAETYSGTRTRNAALGATEKKNSTTFIEAVSDMGDISLLDCYCMMNDIRTGGGRGIPAIPIDQWEGSDLTREHRRLLQKEVNSIEKWGENLNKPQDDNIERMKTFAIKGPEYRKKLKEKRGYGGRRKTRRKKKTRRRRKKRRKSTKKLKLRLTKHRKKRLKKWKVKKTRRN